MDDTGKKSAQIFKNLPNTVKDGYTRLAFPFLDARFAFCQSSFSFLDFIFFQTTVAILTQLTLKFIFLKREISAL
jgi:hypothetical protein